MSEQVYLVLATIAGLSLPIALLFYVRRGRSPLQLLVLAVFAVFMGTIGMGKLLPFFGHSIVGGSLYFPTALLAMTMLGYYHPEKNMLRDASRALLVGSIFMMIGAACWVVFAIYGGEQTTHEYAADMGLLIASITMYFKVYFAASIALYTATWRPEKEWHLVLPTMIEVVVTTPLVVYAAWLLNHETVPTDQWFEIAYWTLGARLLLPAITGVILHLRPMETPKHGPNAGHKIYSGNVRPIGEQGSNSESAEHRSGHGH